MQHYVKALRRYADFKGRSSRPALWWPVLITLVILVVLGGIDRSVFSPVTNGSYEIGPLGLIYRLIWLCPFLALLVRRLHDTDRSGWWILISLTGIGSIFLIYWSCLPGDSGTNSWGPPDGDPSPAESGSESWTYNPEKSDPEGPIIS